MEYNNKKDVCEIFIKRFMIFFSIGTILIDAIVGILFEFFSSYCLPGQINLKIILIFIIIIFCFSKYISLIIKKWIPKININPNNTRKIKKIIYIFLLVLLIISLLIIVLSYMYKLYQNSIDIQLHNFSINSTNPYWYTRKELHSQLIASLLITIIKYIILILLCKSNIEEILLKKKMINKIAYIILLLAIGIFIIAFGYSSGGLIPA